MVRLDHPTEDGGTQMPGNSGYGMPESGGQSAVPPAPDPPPAQFPPSEQFMAGSMGDTQPEVLQQPVMGQIPMVGNPWTSGLFDCDQESTNAIMTAFTPCVTFGQIAEIMDAGETTCAVGGLMYCLLSPALCSQWIMGSMYRTRLRKKYNLVEAPTQDWVAHVCCPFCSLCQEFRELKNRGLDPSLGWLGNLALQQLHGQQQQFMTTPPNNQAMFR